MNAKNEKTEAELHAIFNEVTAFILRKVDADPRHRADMTEHEYMELCEAVIHEDQARPEDDWAIRLGTAIADTRRGMVPGLLAQQEREHAK